MRAKSIALLVLALGCGLVASIGITQVMAKRNVEPEVPDAETATVFVAIEDISLNEPLTAQMLRLEQWPKDNVPAGAVMRIEDLEGRRTRTKLYAGEAILSNKLTDGTGNNASGDIPKGFRVVAVRVKDDSGGGGLIMPGDRVDLLLHVVRNPGRGFQETTTRTILQDIKVFAVNDVVDMERDEAGGKRTINAKTISLLVEPEDAAVVMTATELGTICLVMRSPEDDDIASVREVTPNDLLAAKGSSDRKAEEGLDSHDPSGADASLQWLKKLGRPPAAASGPPAVAPDQHRVRVIQGEEITDVVMRQQGPATAGAPHGRWVADEGAAAGSFGADAFDTAPSPDAGVEPEPETTPEDDA